MVRAAMAAHRRVVGVEDGEPVGGSAWTSSALATAIASRDPNSPTCAVPTLSTMPMPGGAIRVR